VLKALVEVPEANRAKDHVHRTKEAARGRLIHEGLAESGGDEQSTPASQHYCGNEGEDAHEGSAFRTEVQPRYIQGTISCGDVSRGTFTKGAAARTMHTMIARAWCRAGYLVCLLSSGGPPRNPWQRWRKRR